MQRRLFLNLFSDSDQTEPDCQCSSEGGANAPKNCLPTALKHRRRNTLWRTWRFDLIGHSSGVSIEKQCFLWAWLNYQTRSS